MKVLFLLPYPLHKAPSQRFRVEAYFDLLHKKGIFFETQSFLDDDGWHRLYKGGSAVKKAWAVSSGFFRRLSILLRLSSFQYVFIHREAAPLGPPVFEWLIAKVFRKKVIYDFDDAIWIPNISQSNKIALRIKCFGKIRSIVKWSYKVSAGNAFLANWSSEANPNVFINPTCVDMVERYNKMADHSQRPVVIGWTGSHSTLKYLEQIRSVLQRVQDAYKVGIIIICDQPPSFQLDSMQFIKWQERTEINDLIKINIGIMPLTADPWCEGKCGFKLIQYLSLGIPAVASPIGVNKHIIEDGVNGHLCSSEEEWFEALSTLVLEEQKRIRMGQAGKRKMLAEYSVQSNESNFLNLFS